MLFYVKFVRSVETGFCGRYCEAAENAKFPTGYKDESEYSILRRSKFVQTVVGKRDIGQFRVCEIDPEKILEHVSISLSDPNKL